MLQVKGKITVWKDEKGFGFIKSENEMEQVFVHISAFGNISRRPNVGDTVFYKVAIDNNGKQKATNAYIEGVHPIEKTDQKSKIGISGRRKSRFSWLGYIMFIIIIGSFIFYKNPSFFEQFSFIRTSRLFGSIESKSSLIQYQCLGKVYCSEMASYEEAKYYLDHCPNVKIDGDGDGVPCESQFGR